VDMVGAAVDEAAALDYRCVVRGTAEDTHLPSGFFHHVVLWGVFDCVDQERALAEVRRVLRPGGTALITGKNIEYRADDRMALRAERNARRKGFPNSFTDVVRLCQEAKLRGFEHVALARFERRGDMGEFRVSSGAVDAPFYEWVCVVRRAEGEPGGAVSPISRPVSRTVERLAAAAGAADAARFLVELSDEECAA
jgi:hypothetical protein